MSESCFDHEKVDFIRKKAQGLLHFGFSTERRLMYKENTSPAFISAPGVGDLT